MAKNYIVITLFVIISLYNVFALECYTTDLRTLRNKNPQSGKHQLQNCQEYMKDVLRMRGITNPMLPPNINFHCFSLTVDRGANDVVVKGCMPLYGCGLMKNIVTLMMKSGSYGRTHKVQCNECTGIGCNKPRLFEKSSLASSTLLDY
ncbi:uncharacterized protein LOC135133019 [Zophobas morio]|uniref:uncharacterized protein LOC135133019 n=1 Tax=Zophobas morio TaxID=2755281 RepID=UPI0030838C6C